jgi:hypothetical protein
MNRSRFPR